MLPSRYTKRDTPSPLASQLLDSHVIGLLIDEDLRYDPKERRRKSVENTAKLEESDVESANGFFGAMIAEKIRSGKVSVVSLGNGSTVTEETMPLEAAMKEIDEYTAHQENKKIKNYVIFRPYGMGAKLFLHGKDIFTPEAADRFYNEQDRNGSLFNREAIERIERTFLPVSFSHRAGNYYLSKGMTNAEQLLLAVELAKEQYPHIDFSSLPDPQDFMPFVSKFVSLMEDNGVDLAQMLQEAQANTSRYAALAKKKIREEVPKTVDEYLASTEGSEREGNVKRKFGSDLKKYMGDHDWDWEILENFKAYASRKEQGTLSSIEEILESGARTRAISALTELAEGMTNPYDQRFVEPEQSMARILSDSVQPMVLKHALKDKTALLFTSSPFITAFNSDFEHLPDGAYGKYQPNTPKSEHFSNFLMFADRNLRHSNLAHAARHEFEHKVDMDGAIIFATRFKEKIPEMIKNDIEELQKLEDFIRSVKTDSPQLDVNKLLVLGKKRGVKTKPEDMESLKEGLLEDISHIKDRIAVFAPELNNRISLMNEHMYAQTFSQWLEIPAILEELKGEFGRQFIAEALPQLAKATDVHRMQALVPRKQGDSAPNCPN